MSSWTQVDQVWANERQWKVSKEDFENDADIELATRYSVFRIRPRTDFDETSRIVDADPITWNIRGIARMGKWTDVFCSSNGEAP